MCLLYMDRLLIYEILAVPTEMFTLDIGSEARIKHRICVPRSTIYGRGSSLKEINVGYEISGSPLNSIDLLLKQVLFDKQNRRSEQNIPIRQEGFDVYPATFNIGKLTILIPNYLNSPKPSYYALEIVAKSGSGAAQFKLEFVEIGYEFSI